MLKKNKLRRPSLLWLSRDSVTHVRNRIIQLYLGKSECLRAAAPEWSFGVREVLIRSTGGTAVFQFHLKHNREKPVVFTFWLRCKRDANPSWDMQVSEVDGETGEVCILDFNDDRARIPAWLVKQYVRHFPFVPTENYLQNDGEFIA